MIYTGNMVFTHFAGKPEQNLAPMTRAIVEFGPTVAYALYLNEMEGGVVIAAHHIVSRENGKIVTNRTAVAQCVADEIEGLTGFEYAFTLQLDNGMLLDDFVVSEVRTNTKGTQFRTAQPLAIARVRSKTTEVTAPAKQATSGDYIVEPGEGSF